MKKIYIILVFMFIFFNISFSQPWVVVQSSPSVMLTDMCMMQDGLTGWAVGSTAAQNNILNGLYKTTNGGTNWAYQSFSNSSAIQGVFFIDADTGWIVGSAGTIYKSLDGGSNWAIQVSGSGRILYRAYFINANTGWIAGGRQDGSNYCVLKTTNGGTNWQDLSFGTGAYSNECVFFLNDMTGWVSGSDNTIAGAVHKTTDGGATWTRKTLPVTTTICTNIKFANANKGWASSSSIYNTGPIYYSSDGGETWVVQTNTNQHYMYLDVKDSMNVAFLGSRVLSPAGTHVFVTTNGGVNWTDNNTPISNYANAVKYIGSNIWIGADYTQILKSTNSGANWAFQNRSYRLRSITWSSPTTGWISGNTNLGVPGFTMKTTDAGVTWIPQTNVPGTAQVFFVNANYGWVLMEGNSAYIWRTTDGGANWAQNFVGASGWTGGMFFINQNSGWAYGSNGNLRFTSNGGVSWGSQNPANSNYIEDVFFINSNTGWLAGGYSSGNAFISITTNGGTNWTPQAPALSTHILDLFFIDSLYGWAASLNGGTQKTTNGGINWIPAASVAETYPQRILMRDQNTGWLVSYFLASGGNSGLGSIYKTTDGANSWVNEYTTPWPKTDLNDISIQGTNTLWAVGNHGTIMKYDILIGIKQIGSNVPDKFSLSQNYPNPFNPATKIRFSIPLLRGVSADGGRCVLLKVYDILGREVQTLVNESLQPGIYEVDFDGNNFSSGVYYYTLSVRQAGSSTGDYFVTKKMVLIK